MLEENNDIMKNIIWSGNIDGGNFRILEVQPGVDCLVEQEFQGKFEAVDDDSLVAKVYMTALLEEKKAFEDLLSSLEDRF